MAGTTPVNNCSVTYTRSWPRAAVTSAISRDRLRSLQPRRLSPLSPIWKTHITASWAPTIQIHVASRCSGWTSWSMKTGSSGWWRSMQTHHLMSTMIKSCLMEILSKHYPSLISTSRPTCSLTLSPSSPQPVYSTNRQLVETSKNVKSARDQQLLPIMVPQPVTQPQEPTSSNQAIPGLYNRVCCG